MGSIWNGVLAFGMVSIPVGIHAAAEGGQSFKMLHKKDLQPIRYQPMCTGCGKAVERDEIVKGLPSAAGGYTVIDPEELEKARAEDGCEDKVIRIINFVDSRTEVSPFLYDSPYLLSCLKGGERAYSTLREAMIRGKRSAMVRFALRTTPRLGLLTVSDHHLSVVTLRDPDSLRPAEIAPVPMDKVCGLAEVNLALQIINSAVEEFKPEPSAYRAAVKALMVKATMQQTKVKKQAEVHDLMSALRASMGLRRAKATRRSA